MPHLHFCDVAGHEFECDKPTCACICGKAMNGSDHSECPVELMACPAHINGLQVGEVAIGVAISIPADVEGRIEHALEQLESFDASCLWCGHGYEDYCPKAEDEHFACHCPDAPEELREHAKKRLLLGDYENDDESAEEPEGHAETE